MKCLHNKGYIVILQQLTVTQGLTAQVLKADQGFYFDTVAVDGFLVCDREAKSYAHSLGAFLLHLLPT